MGHPWVVLALALAAINGVAASPRAEPRKEPRADSPAESPAAPCDRQSLLRRLGNPDRMLARLDAAPWRRTDVVVVESVYEADQTYYGERLWDLDHYIALDPQATRVLLYSGVLQPSLDRPWTLRRMPELKPVPAPSGGIDVIARSPAGPLRIGHVEPSGRVAPIAPARPASGDWIYDPFLDEILERIPSRSVIVPPLDPDAAVALDALSLTVLEGDAVGVGIQATIEAPMVGHRQVPVLVVAGVSRVAGTIGEREEATLAAMRALPGHLLSVDSIAFPALLFTLDPAVARIDGATIRISPPVLP